MGVFREAAPYYAKREWLFDMECRRKLCGRPGREIFHVLDAVRTVSSAARCGGCSCGSGPFYEVQT